MIDRLSRDPDFRLADSVGSTSCTITNAPVGLGGRLGLSVSHTFARRKKIWCAKAERVLWASTATRGMSPIVDVPLVASWLAKRS